MSVVTELLRLNVGAGNRRLKAGYTTLDADPGMQPDILARVPPIPLADGSVAALYAGHFIEHLESAEADAFIAECYRVLAPGGELEIVVPYALDHSAWQDPTHRSFWVPERFLYYTPHYDYLAYTHLERRFRLVELAIDEDEGYRTVHARLQKPECEVSHD